MTDVVNHPPHYTSHPSGVECIEITEHMNFNLGNAIKYIWRADGKGKALEDLAKAKFYIEREIARRTDGTTRLDRLNGIYVNGMIDGVPVASGRVIDDFGDKPLGD